MHVSSFSVHESQTGNNPGTMKGTSGNKDWAACLAVETDDQQTSSPMIAETTEVIYLSIYGPHGGNVVVDPPKRLAMTQARKHFRKKCREKDGKAYAHVPFAPYLPAFGRPFGLSLLASAEGGKVDGGEDLSAHAQEDETTPLLNYQAVVVKDAPLAKIQQLLAGESYALSEKVNGERFMYNLARFFEKEHRNRAQSIHNAS
jgi:hypothetical protein